MVDTFLGIQILAISFAVFMLYVVFLHFKKGELTSSELIFWICLWLGFIFFALFPHVLNPIISTLYIARAMDLLMIIAFMILTVLSFFTHLSVSKLRRELTEFIRKEAIKHVKKT